MIQKKEKAFRQSFPMMRVLLSQNNKEINEKIFWTYFHSSKYNNKTLIQEMIDEPTLKRILKYLNKNDNRSLKFACLRIVTNLSSYFLKRIVGVLESLQKILDHQKQSFRREAT